ncbi:hypothetical protein AA23498_0025 [Acetobacter nitrogenifigens DSM 23921 = NBRC 105050]|uniref:Lipoprotein n=1 Tax=Acetobacter nitrogenifigens DSM 23921 = NBRC 105050 TaxID=1120919 RepID=A0A511X956_9PROT|nr:hypothetical protein [Acetobacter nitrogenifigens]GBQ87014.1 hypothetical protein AA23498_0025 [Acetobacter nitrogenifigens DSM 23921 = NBRC 105050]GEN59462.1 hypothetical protein ANI02nite_13460 [Acetobacter nitrogenifigens DSM 23921 = NBRC 105050]
MSTPSIKKTEQQLAAPTLRIHTALPLLTAFFLSGCYEIGPTRLDRDQSDYSRALTSASKQQTLLNVVRLRYADTPGFLDTTQLISGYQLQRNVSVGIGTYSVATRPYGGIAAQLQESPTFTFQPVTGDAYAESFLRPLPPANLLPLVMGGLPIDVLFRLSVQSVNLINNVGPMGGENARGTPVFFDLLSDLRALQLAGLLGIQLERTPQTQGMEAQPDRVYLSIMSSDDPVLSGVVREVRRLLGMAQNDERVEVTYGGGRPRPGQIRLLTRTILGVLGQIAYQIEVPQDDIVSGRTRPTIRLTGHEKRPIVVIHVANEKPDSVFVWTTYNHKYYWIADNDYDSKLAFTMLQILLELSKTSKEPNTIVTIPANG